MIYWEADLESRWSTSLTYRPKIIYHLSNTNFERVDVLGDVCSWATSQCHAVGRHARRCEGLLQTDHRLYQGKPGLTWMPQMLDEAKPENPMMFDFTREYGVYR